jgi:hypothetical protein
LTEAVTQEDKQSGVLVNSVQETRLADSEVRLPIGLSLDGDRN